MTCTVCIFANCIAYPEGGGHLWVYLNWALGFRRLGCRVIWMEAVRGPPHTPTSKVQAWATALQERLARYGLVEEVALWSWSGESVPAGAGAGCLDAAADADLLLNFEYSLPQAVVSRFRRSALMDIDPGLLQVWINQGDIKLARHDVYFTTGETVGQPGAKFPDGGVPWHYTPPCIALDWWVPTPAPTGVPFTTVSHWYAGEWVQNGSEGYENNKRTGFLPFLDLPQRTRHPLELALRLGDDEESAALRQLGWRVREASEISSTPWDYQRYVQGSRGEFSCSKPSTVRMQNAWVSDRTLCYLASGKPAVVQHTGPSRFLPDHAGLFRFRTPEEAARHLDTAAADYQHHSRLARALAEEFFDARTVAARVLERALG